ncbi:MAG: hypothetical protein ABF636_04975 [Acetobacter sp.]
MADAHTVGTGCAGINPLSALHQRGIGVVFGAAKRALGAWPQLLGFYSGWGLHAGGALWGMGGALARV